MHHRASLNSTSQGTCSKSSNYGENEVRVLNVAATCLCVIKVANVFKQDTCSKSYHYGENEVRVLNVATTCLCVIKGSECV